MNSIFSFILFTFLCKNGPLNAKNCHRPVQMMRIENNNKNTGGSHGLVVMGNDSYLKGCRFESWCLILDGHWTFFHIDLL